MYVTNYRLKLVAYESTLRTRGLHGRAVRGHGAGGLGLPEAVFEELSFPTARPDAAFVDTLKRCVEDFAFPATHEDLRANTARLEKTFAFAYKLHDAFLMAAAARAPAAEAQSPPPPRAFDDGWTSTRPLSSRGLPRRSATADWRLWHDSYDLSDTYPMEFVVPARLGDDLVREAAAYRSKTRVPAAVWRSPRTGAVLCRSSQPMAGVAYKSSRADQLLLNLYRCRGAEGSLDAARSASDPRRRAARRRTPGGGDLPIHIVDCRGRAAALGNRAQGKGTEAVGDYENATLKYCDIGNIHTMRESQQQLVALLGAPDDESVLYHSALEATGWLKHLALVLKASIHVARRLEDEGASVLVHCSDGWDRTAQVCATAQLLLDPYYRTVEGFAVLVEKEWCAFGHKFAERLGVARREALKPNERSPVFVQWLECVAWVLRQFPRAFEFSEALLVFVADGAASGLFGTFLGDTERDRKPSTGPSGPARPKARPWHEYYSRFDAGMHPATPMLCDAHWFADAGDFAVASALIDDEGDDVDLDDQEPREAKANSTATVTRDSSFSLGVTEEKEYYL
ncbi:phosphatidylinositol-3,5-bisphosphate 3-phosphatase [Aureococcus anophagefferens]|nr:phosphatidylinositol-3,5-bisphosphate 3-phosphatase [Aureococcus anophagefferens]